MGEKNGQDTNLWKMLLKSWCIVYSVVCTRLLTNLSWELLVCVYIWLQVNNLFINWKYSALNCVPSCINMMFCFRTQRSIDFGIFTILGFWTVITKQTNKHRVKGVWCVVGHYKCSDKLIYLTVVIQSYRTYNWN